MFSASGSGTGYMLKKCQGSEANEGNCLVRKGISLPFLNYEFVKPVVLAPLSLPLPTSLSCFSHSQVCKREHLLHPDFINK